MVPVGRRAFEIQVVGKQSEVYRTEIPFMKSVETEEGKRVKGVDQGVV